MGWKVIISPSADRNLEETVTFVARDNPDAALRLGEELIEKALSIANFPEMGRIVPEFKRPDIREIIHRRFRIVYRVRKETSSIEILRFWHGARGTPWLPH